MTTEELKEIAEKYADEVWGDDGTEGQKKTEAEYAFQVLSWLFKKSLLHEDIKIPWDVKEIAREYSKILEPGNKWSRGMLYLDLLGFLDRVLERYDLRPRNEEEW